MNTRLRPIYRYSPDCPHRSWLLAMLNHISFYFSQVKCYDARDKTWHYVASMNAARSKLSMAEVNGVIYAMGGFDGSTTLNTVENYTIATNK